jgi:DNA-binding transcriptional LysR family regulator
MDALDIKAVEAFVLAADLQSFTRAAEALLTTQSAVSIKIRRLEEVFGKRLLERTPRSVRLSPDGQLFLPVARTLVGAHRDALEAFSAERHSLVVGLSHHVVGPRLPALLKHMNSTIPGLELQVQVSMSHDLSHAFDGGKLDAVVLLDNPKRRRAGEVLYRESFGWMTAPDFAYRAGEPLRVATQANPCSVREMALGVLKTAGITWKEVFVGGGVPVVAAAASAGLAVAPLGSRIAPSDTIEVGAKLGLPPLPDRDVVLLANLSGRRARASLRVLASALQCVVPQRPVDESSGMCEDVAQCGS